MPERLSALLVGLIVMLVGIGMFLWDWYGEYIHFIWIIPFLLAGPIVFISGLIIVFKALFSGKESFRKTMPPQESTETVRPYPTPLRSFRLNVERMEKRKDVEGLIKALRHRDKYVRMSAAGALGEIGDVRAVEPLIQALKDKNWLARRAVAVALGFIGDARAVEPLIQALKDEVEYVRMIAAEALGFIGDARAVEPLTRALKDKNLVVQENAREALQKMGFKETKPPKESKEKVHRYYNDKYGFSIEPPSGWTVDDSGRMFDKLQTELDKATIKQLKRSTVVNFFGPREEDTMPTISIAVGDRLGTETLHEWVSRFKQGPIPIPDFQLLSEGTIVVGGVDAYEEVHTSRSLLDPVYQKQKQVVLLKDSRVYTIVYTSSPTYFDKYLHAFDASVQTFKFKSRAGEVPPPSSIPSARAPEMFDLREKTTSHKKEAL